MTPLAIAQQFAEALQAIGINAEPHANSLSNGYGHKLTVQDRSGARLGNLVVYTGQHGPRYTTNELRTNSPDLLKQVQSAWMFCQGPLPTSGNLAEKPAVPSITPDTLELWVDGACLHECLHGTTGLRFGWAFAVCKDGEILHQHTGSTIAPHAVCHRNVAAEIQAVIAGVQWCTDQGYRSITIFHDYEGLEAWATGRWKANTEYTQAYQRNMRGIETAINWKKVPAHSGVPMNELVDRLATTAAKMSFERHALPHAKPSQ